MRCTLYNYDPETNIIKQIMVLSIFGIFVVAGCNKTTVTAIESLDSVSMVYSNASHMVYSYKFVPRAKERLEIILVDDQQSVVTRSFVEKFNKDRLKSLAMDAMDEMVKYKAIRDEAVPSDMEVLSLINTSDGISNECQIVGSRKQHLEFYVTTRSLLELLHLASDGQPKAYQMVYYSLTPTNCCRPN